jgi:hypothetical protein
VGTQGVGIAFQQVGDLYDGVALHAQFEHSSVGSVQTVEQVPDGVVHLRDGGGVIERFSACKARVDASSPLLVFGPQVPPLADQLVTNDRQRQGNELLRLGDVIFSVPEAGQRAR